jgi:hypothetical protein
MFGGFATVPQLAEDNSRGDDPPEPPDAGCARDAARALAAARVPFTEKLRATVFTQRYQGVTALLPFLTKAHEAVPRCG